MRINKNKRKFIYLISPDTIENTRLFYKELEKILRLKKIFIFQLRLKNYKEKQITSIGRKVKILCKAYGTRFIINDNPYIAKKLGADGCHLGQKDMQFVKAKSIL